MRVMEILVDCDADTLLYSVQPPARPVTPARALVFLQRLVMEIED